MYVSCLSLFCCYVIGWLINAHLNKIEKKIIIKGGKRKKERKKERESEIPIKIKGRGEREREREREKEKKKKGRKGKERKGHKNFGVFLSF